MDRYLDILLDGRPDRQALAQALALDDPAACARLYEAAYEVKRRHVGTVAYLRGIIEFSNVCRKDCLYCGIRRSNQGPARYTMTDDEIVAAARWADTQGYGSLVLQSGERQDEAFTTRVTALLERIAAATDGRLGITLSLGEQTAATYARWRAAGAHRYLLRIETSNPDLYARLHPRDHDFDTRLDCLRRLRETGYQVGSGMLIGLPGQTAADLAADIRFLAETDVDMVGMGPYIPHPDTPLAAHAPAFDPARQLTLGLNAIAAARLVLRDVNIAATTALQALDPAGREAGLRAGANVVMPNITPLRYRAAYRLYDGKPCTDETAEACRDCLARRIGAIGERVGYGQWGDAPHAAARAAREAAA